MSSSTSQHHLILIHGAWAGSWVWDACTPIFSENFNGRYSTHTVDLPDSPDVNLDVYCNVIQDLIQSIVLRRKNEEQNNHVGEKGQPLLITLVAHSGAGVIALQVAENLGYNDATVAADFVLHGLVVVAGMLLPSGLTYPAFRATLAPGLQVEPLSLHFSPDNSSSVVPKEAALACFFQDWPDQTAAVQAATRLRAQPTAGLAIAPEYRPDGGAVRIPKLYVEATKDESVRIGVQRAMQEIFRKNSRHLSTRKSSSSRDGLLRVVTIETGHVPQVVQPRQFCQYVADFVESIGQFWEAQERA